MKVNIYIDYCGINQTSHNKVIDVKTWKNITCIVISLFDYMSTTLQKYDNHKSIKK